MRQQSRMEKWGKMGLARRIHLTEFDHRRLLGLLALVRHRLGLGLRRELEEKMSGAIVLPQARIPRDVVTMNSKVLIRDLTTQVLRPLRLAFPGAPKSDTPDVSILAPLGMALLGARESEEILLLPGRQACRWLVEKVAYQPEASGNFVR